MKRAWEEVIVLWIFVQRADGDSYLLVPCEVKGKHFVLSFSESLKIDSVAIQALEIYASAFRHIQLLGFASPHCLVASARSSRPSRRAEWGCCVSCACCLRLPGRTASPPPPGVW